MENRQKGLRQLFFPIFIEVLFFMLVGSIDTLMLSSVGDDKVGAVGAVLLDAFPELKVDVHNPQVMLNVEIREKIYIYSQIIPGPGGMPVGTSGKAMLLLSGGKAVKQKTKSTPFAIGAKGKGRKS